MIFACIAIPCSQNGNTIQLYGRTGRRKSACGYLGTHTAQPGRAPAGFNTRNPPRTNGTIFPLIIQNQTLIRHVPSQRTHQVVSLGMREKAALLGVLRWRNAAPQVRLTTNTLAYNNICSSLWVRSKFGESYGTSLWSQDQLSREDHPGNLVEDCCPHLQDYPPACLFYTQCRILTDCGAFSNVCSSGIRLQLLAVCKRWKYWTGWHTVKHGVVSPKSPAPQESRKKLEILGLFRIRC